MIHTPAERQAWHDLRVAQFATPDPTVETIRGRDWARVRPMLCANCKRPFYGWQLLESFHEPWGIDTRPGQRQTCGHPLCWKADDERAYQERRAAGHPTHATHR